MTSIYAAQLGADAKRIWPDREGDIALRRPLNVLASFAFYESSDMSELGSWGLRVIADSGAFSAVTQGVKLDLEKYAAWIKRWRDHFHWAANLDVIGDAEGSWRNWQALTAAGVATVPTVHYPLDPEGLDRYVEAGADFIGLGGMVPYRSEPKRLLRWCAAMMRYARDTHPELKFHGWGVTHPGLLLNLPWWSVDSSGYAAAYRYARLQLFDPERGRMTWVNLRTGREAAAHRPLLARHYGLADWRRIAVSNTETRRDLVRVALRSFQLAEDFMGRRWKVEPPPSLAHAGTGPSLHAALGSPSMQPTRSLSPNDRPPRTLKETP